jgi:hypothetical protein
VREVMVVVVVEAVVEASPLSCVCAREVVEMAVVEMAVVEMAVVVQVVVPVVVVGYG